MKIFVLIVLFFIYKTHADETTTETSSVNTVDAATEDKTEATTEENDTETDEESIDSENLRKRGPSFIFTYPKTFLSGRNETVCLSLHDGGTPTKVLVDLKINDQHYITRQNIETEHTCFQIAVPSLNYENVKVHYASLHLQVQLNGTMYSGHNRAAILVYPNDNIIFVETDRSFYKPGDNVKIRILALNNEMKAPVNYKIPLVKLSNPMGITVAVWENVATELGLAQIEHQLTQDTTTGKWLIQINETTKSFEVKQYVLPRFQVNLHHPKTIYTESKTVSFSVCAKYSYGKHVNGMAVIKINFQNAYEEISSKKELTNGCAEFEFSKEKLHLDEQVYGELQITGTVTEKGTDRVETDNGKSSVTNQGYVIKFDEDNKYFQPGLPYHGKLIATDSQIPLDKEVVEICYNVAVDQEYNVQSVRQCSNYTFNQENSIDFTLLPLANNVVNIPLDARSLTHHIKYPTSNYKDDITAYFSLNRWHSKSKNYIQLDKTSPISSKCNAMQQFAVYYTTKNLKDNNPLTFYYMIKTRDQLLNIHKISQNQNKRHAMNYSQMENVVGSSHNYTNLEVPISKFILKVKLDQGITSKSQLLVYYVLPNGEPIAADADLNVEKCLKNKVESKWSHMQYYPGESATLTIKTEPNSLCAVSAVDKSTTFMGHSKPLNIHSVFKPFLREKEAKESDKPNCISKSKRKGDGERGFFRGGAVPMGMAPGWELRRRKRFYPMYGSTSTQYDTFEAFSNFGVSVITNLKLITKPCNPEPDYYFRRMDFPVLGFAAAPMPALSLAPAPPPMGFQGPVEYDVQQMDRGVSVRSYFPETWLWDLVPISEKGETKFTRDIPHTITNWNSNTMCVSPTSGIGFSPPVEVTVFQPFFLEILTPYSIKRNEVLHLQVVLFNYLNHSVPIRMSIKESEGLELLGTAEERNVTHCIKPSDSQTAIFRIIGIKLGKLNVTVSAEVDSSYPGECGPEVIINKRDVVIKDLLVEPEGHKVEKTQSALLCMHGSSDTNNVTWDLEIPKNVVSDSDKAVVSISSDLMGPTIENLEQLLTVPTGCGEQIMSTLAPNMYILKYLSASGKLTRALKERAVRNLQIGYQRILAYVRNDGSFSAFGNSDPNGSMFLTAFVIRTLQQAKAYIYVDENVINRAVQWVFQHQLENGCFDAVYHVFHDMGGTSTENSTAALTSYVLISLLESGIELPEKVQKNAKYCIQGHFSPAKYTLAVGTYALSLLGWNAEAQKSLEKLLDMATTKKNLMWWSDSGASTTNIEMTAYVLISLLEKNTTQNLAYANSVMRWLTTQRGPQGGFESTQDTVVALDAISRYLLLTKKSNPNMSVRIVTSDQDKDISIKSEESLKTKQMQVKTLPNTVTVVANGAGCVLAQAILRYNLPQIPNSEAFKLAVDVEPVSSMDMCSVAMISPCLSYTGPGHSNMAILEVTMPSGYEPDRASLFKLTEQHNSKMKRFEEKENHVILYFTKLDNEPICVPFTINENSVVETRVDANIKLYDYYNPDLQVSKTYTMDKCKANEIAPIPALPVNGTGKVNNFTNDFMSAENSTQGKKDNVTELKKKDEHETQVEGKETTTTKGEKDTTMDIKNKDIHETQTDSNQTTTTKTIVKRDTSTPKNPSTRLNPDFVDMDIDMNVPDGNLKLNQHIRIVL